MKNKTTETEVQSVAKQINDILLAHGMEMMPVIQIFKKPQSPVVAAGTMDDLEDILTKTSPSPMPDFSKLSPEGIITKPTVDDQKFADIMKPIGDKIGK